MPTFTTRAHPNASFSLQGEICFQVYAAYEDSALDEEMLAWHYGAISRIEKYSVGGGYVGDSNLFVHPVAVLHPDNAARLENCAASTTRAGASTATPRSFRLSGSQAVVDERFAPRSVANR